MAIPVIMPKQGLQMTEGTIIQWLAKEGDKVEAGKPLFEMETDKLTITMDAEASGTLLKIVRGEGETVPITELIAVIGEPGENISDLLARSASEPEPQEKSEQEQQESSVKKQEVPFPSDGRVFTSPRARMRAEEKGIALASVSGSGPEGLVIERDVLAFDPLRATPLARKVAAAAGTALEDVTGTGSHGKITKSDVLAAQASANVREASETIIPLRGMRKIIAARMRESLSVNAQTFHNIRVDMSNAEKLRAVYKVHDKKVSYNDLILKAACMALQDFPILNAELRAEEIVLKHYVNIGVAVAVDNGLIVPNIKGAEKMRLEEISTKARELADKAKNNALQPDDYAGGTFTVSNLGMFGLDSFTAIINPPETGILAVGKIEKTPVVQDDVIVIRPIMSLTLSYDHRIVDGAPAAQFLARVKDYLENPCLML